MLSPDDAEPRALAEAAVAAAVAVAAVLERQPE